MFLSVKKEPTREGLIDKRKVDSFNEVKYTYYYFRTDFHTAVALCTAYHESLANVYGIELANHMNQFMYKSRPGKY